MRPCYFAACSRAQHHAPGPYRRKNGAIPVSPVQWSRYLFETNILLNDLPAVRPINLNNEGAAAGDDANDVLDERKTVKANFIYHHPSVRLGEDVLYFFL